MSVNPGTIGLEAWWSLDEESGVRVDAHGSNDLADNNTVLFDTGIVNNAADFELATTEFLSIADNASLSFGDEDFSVGFWKKLESNPAIVAPVSKWNFTNNDREYQFLYRDADQIIEFRVSDDGTNVAQIPATTFGSLSLATFYFVVGVHDSVNNLIKISVNATAFDTLAHTTGCNDNIASLVIGADDDGAVNHFDGLIDEAFVYRKALSADNIGWLYNGGSGRAYQELISGSNIFYM